MRGEQRRDWPLGGALGPGARPQASNPGHCQGGCGARLAEGSTQGGRCRTVLSSRGAGTAGQLCALNRGAPLAVQGENRASSSHSGPGPGPRGPATETRVFLLGRQQWAPAPRLLSPTCGRHCRPTDAKLEGLTPQRQRRGPRPGPRSGPRMLCLLPSNRGVSRTKRRHLSLRVSSPGTVPIWAQKGRLPWGCGEKQTR